MSEVQSKLTIGIADMKFAQKEGLLVTYALGSCIGICLYDSVAKVGGLLHIMLPLNMEAGRKNPLKYADTGFAEMVKQITRMGASPSRLTAKLAGGAKMFEVNGSSSLGNIGQRNIESVHMQLKKHGVRLIKEDVGGSVARTLLFNVSDGSACIRSYGKPELII